MPLAFIYILYQFLNGQTALFTTAISTDLLLIGSRGSDSHTASLFC